MSQTVYKGADLNYQLVKTQFGPFEDQKGPDCTSIRPILRTKRAQIGNVTCSQPENKFRL